MQVLFAFLVLAFALHSINTMNANSVEKAKVSASAKDTHFNVEMQSTLGGIFKKAYDRGRTLGPGGSCPAGTIQFNGVGSSQRRLCWDSAAMVDRCFEAATYKGKRICLAGSQTSVTSIISPPINFVEFLLAPSLAYAITIRQPADYGDYSLGLILQNAAPTAVAGGNSARATVRIPTADSFNRVRSNYVSCNTPYTECLTVVYCLNGSSACSGPNRFASTYAVRYF